MFRRTFMTLAATAFVATLPLMPAAVAHPHEEYVAEQAAKAAAPAGQQSSAATVASFKAALAAGESDPRMVAKLFVAAMVAYEKDATLGRALMALAVVPGDAVRKPTSPSGLDIFKAREIYFRTLNKNTKLGRIYLDQPARGDAADVAAVATHVVIDEEYKARGIGINEQRGTAKFYIKLNELGGGKRSRPISLKRANGKWRVQEYSSLFIQI